MFTLSKKELKNVSLDAEHKDFQVNSEKFCKVSEDIKAELELAELLVKSVFWKWMFQLAGTMLEAVRKKMGCTPGNI
jgi:hypothetical protein